MRKRIGDFLLEKGLINRDDIDEIVRHSKRSGLRFGEAALELGFLKQKDLIKLFGPNFSIDFFHLEPQYFPPQTADLIPKEEIIRLGVLPLGIKTEYRFFRRKKLLNLGMLNPTNKQTRQTVEKAVENKLTANTLSGVKVYLVLADQFLDVLQSVYSITESDLRNQNPQAVDETLQMFLEKPSS